MTLRFPFILSILVLSLHQPGCVNSAPDDGGKTASNTDGGKDGKSSRPGPLKPFAPVTAEVVAPSPQVDHLELEASPPTTINMDDKPGPDGVMLKMRLYNLQQPLAFQLERGEVEVLLFEGNIRPTELTTAQPLHIWKITAADLRPLSAKSLVGNYYTVTLAWGDKSPSSSTITVIARIPHPSAAPLYSSRIVLTTGPR